MERRALGLTGGTVGTIGLGTATWGRGTDLDEARAQVSLLVEAGGNLDRRTEGLADTQTLLHRAAEGQGLTRPELAVLLSSAKLVLQDAIEKSQLANDPALEPTLFQAFPAPMRSAWRRSCRRLSRPCPTRRPGPQRSSWSGARHRSTSSSGS